jgi:hypothetical protein
MIFSEARESGFVVACMSFSFTKAGRIEARQ